MLVVFHFLLVYLLHIFITFAAMKMISRHIFRRLLTCCLCLVALPMYLLATPSDGETATYRQLKITAKHLDNLHTPRSGHATLYINGELTVFGGHTSGFLPTSTAEYYKDGKWHQMQMVYAHDGGTVIPLKSGKVLLAGGFEKHLGIGQTFVVEMYDPAKHSFVGFGCLDKKRVAASGIEMDSSQVYIAGNWYSDDAIEHFDGNESFSFVKDVAQQRYLPHLLRIAPDNFLIFGGYDIHGDNFSNIIVDQLKGDTLHIPLLDEWRPLQYDFGHQCDNSFIGNEAKGIYAYLLPVKNKEGEVAIMLIEGTRFSLLPTACPIPTKSQWGEIRYYSPVVVDQKVKRGYMMGIDKDCRQYILAIEYNKRIDQGVPLTLYYTDPMPDVCNLPVVTPEGNLMMAGGVNFQTNNNYSPSSSAYLFPVGTPEMTSQPIPWWLWMATGILVALLLIYLIYYYVRKKRPTTTVETVSQGKTETANASNELLMQRLCLLMEEQKPFLNSELKVSDVAALLGTNNRYISESIKSTRNITFAQFINTYRISYAQQLLRQQPTMKMTEVYIKSGFANETSFFRTFKAHTGMTPKEWLTKID